MSEPRNGQCRYVRTRHYVCGDMGFPPQITDTLEQWWDGAWHEVEVVEHDAERKP